MNKKDYAFPSTFKSLNGNEQTHCFGMSLRDYFAAKAMQVFLEKRAYQFVQVAQYSYEMADKMLAKKNAKT